MTPLRPVIFLLLLFVAASAMGNPIDLTKRHAWADSILNGLTLDQKIGQLFMVPAYSNKGPEHEKELLRMIRQYHIGGVIAMQGGPVRQVRLLNNLQAASAIPLLVSQDAEWGLGMRLDSTWSFPRQLTLGAIKDPQLIYQMGALIAAHCKRVGVHLNFAPVADINNNVRNPVINDRSFGENRFNVSLRSIQYMRGMQENGVMACAKHFPGHGDTDKDSHYDLPVITHGRDRLDSLELFPFRLLVAQGVMSVMTAHLYMPQLEPVKNLAASLSPNVVDAILRQEMGYKGLIVTDALNMQGAKGFNAPGEMELRALLAGNDILLFPSDIPKAVARIKQALEKGELTQETLDMHVRKVLNAKLWVGLDNWQPLSEEGLYESLVNTRSQAMHRKLLSQAITVARDADSLLPFRMADTLKLATLQIGKGDPGVFQRSFERYAPATHFRIAKEASESELSNLLPKLDSFDVVVVALREMSRFHNRQFGTTASTRKFLEALAARKRTVLCVFGSPYSLSYFEKQSHVVVAYEDTEHAFDLVPQVLFGGIPAKGQMPVTASDGYQFGAGITASTPIRLSFGLPEELDYSSWTFSRIDSLALQAIRERATPGCQVLVAKDGKVIYEKAFGFHTYDSTRPVNLTDLYDVASLTKIAATTITLMYLYDLGLFRPFQVLSDYLPQLKGTVMGRLKMNDILTHTAGLKAWIPFFKPTLHPDIYDFFYCDYGDDTYCVPVARNLFMMEGYVDTILSIMANTPLEKPGNYKYSDLGFYMLVDIIKALTLEPLDEFALNHFYRPLGLRHCQFHPLMQFSQDQIVPTQNDMEFRRQLVHGHVHDPGAAMMGGVSGHAGLFSNAHDMAVIMQMLLNKGNYAGERYLKEATVELFTRRYDKRSRRGLGFDKPETDLRVDGPTSKLVSFSTFGHTGFTGTCAWTDPENGLVYVFLSNRIHPDQENKKLIRMNTRTRIQDAIYIALATGTGDRDFGLLNYNND